MGRRIRIVTVCGCGLGSSLMAKAVIEKITREFGITAVIEASDAGTAKGYLADIFVTTTMLRQRVGEIPGTPVLAVKSFMNENELRETLRPYLEEFKLKNP